MSAPPELLYYTELLLNGSADDSNRLWTILQTEYVFMAGVMLVMYAEDGARASYYTHNLRSDHLGRQSTASSSSKKSIP